MLESLKSIDEGITLSLNGAHSEFWDSVMLIITSKYTWVPLYALIVGLFVYAYRKRSLVLIAGFVLMIIFTDRFSSGFAKPYFERPRPCKSVEIGQKIHNPGGCRSAFGFFSSHASNSFAFAMLLFLLERKRNRWMFMFLVWAAIVSYSRVYVGVHYIGDILVGAIFGILSAYLFRWIIRKGEKVIFKEDLVFS